MCDQQNVTLPASLSDWNDESPNALNRVPYKLSVIKNSESISVLLHREGDPDWMGMEMLIEIDSGLPRVILSNRCDGSVDAQLSIHAHQSGFDVITMIGDQIPQKGIFNNSQGNAYQSFKYAFPLERSPEGSAWEHAMKAKLGIETSVEEIRAGTKPPKVKF